MSSFPASSLLTGLVAWYRNNGTDHSGNGNVLTPVGSPTTTTGINGIADEAMLVDDANRFTRSPLVTGGNFTWSGWVRREGGTNPGFILSQGGSGGGTQILQIGLIEIIAATFFVAGTSNPSAQISGPTGVDFQLYVCVYDAANLAAPVTLYVNGSGLSASVVDTANFVGNTSFDIGINLDELVPVQNIGVWNRPLTTDEINKLYNGSAGSDPTA